MPSGYRKDGTKIIPPTQKGKKWTEEMKKNRSILAKERGYGKWMNGKKLSEETKRKIGLNGFHFGMLGKKASPETKQKMREAQSHGSEHHNWKGDDGGYHAMHKWIERTLGTPKKCEHCGTTEKRMYHWSNKGHSYKRNTEDWQRLCVPCHKKYDMALV